MHVVTEHCTKRKVSVYLGPETGDLILQLRSHLQNKISGNLAFCAVLSVHKGCERTLYVHGVTFHGGSNGELSFCTTLTYVEFSDFLVFLKTHVVFSERCYLVHTASKVARKVSLRQFFA